MVARQCLLLLLLLPLIGPSVGQDVAAASQEGDLVGRVPESWLKPLLVEPEEPQAAFTERVPLLEVTRPVPASWLRPVPFETLLAAPGDGLVGRLPPSAEEDLLAAPEDELVGRLPPSAEEDLLLAPEDELVGRLPPSAEEDLLARSAVVVQLRWVTPIQLLFARPQSVQNGAKLPSSGKFRVPDGYKVTFTSPNYPGKYPPYQWTTWNFVTPDKSSTVSLSCSTFELGKGDYLIVTGSGGQRSVYYSGDKPPSDSSIGKLQVEFRSNSVDHGRLSCSIRVSSGSSSGTSSSQESETVTPTTTRRPVTAAPTTVAPTTAAPTTVAPTTVAPTTAAPTTAAPAAVAPTAASWLNDPKCGRTKYDTRIVGGGPAPANAYPWLVGLVSPRSSRPFCGGSIINERFILTAAHCVRGRSATKLNIMVRKHQRNSDPDQVRLAVKRIIQHPGYNTVTQDKDMALVELSGSIRKYLSSSDGRVRAICLPTSSCPSCLAGRTAVLAGWGVLRSDTSDVPVTVQHVQVPIITNSACTAAYAKDQIGVTSNMVCAGLEKGGKDTCQGDSGGPMMLKGSGNVYTLGGIVSFGKGCAAPGYPGVYTRVSEFYEWIKSNSRL